MLKTKTVWRLWLIVCIGCVIWNGHASVLYVDANTKNPVSPFANWETAASNIQDAIDAANAGDLILVTNGIYQSGGRAIAGSSLTNRIVLDKAVTVQSVNGPLATTIEGYQAPGILNGSNAMRCAYLADGANLTGFTIQHGATLQLNLSTNADARGGGVYCFSTNALISNCIIVTNACSLYGAGAFSGTLDGCEVDYNVVHSSGSFGAGAAANARLVNSVVNGNTVAGIGESGAGAYSCVLSNCTISGNRGGGAAGSTVDHCVVNNNTNSYGGGATKCVLNDCRIYNNQATMDGGGVFDCALSQCIVSNNWSARNGGGVYSDALQTNAPGANNILIGNSCASFGGGLYLGTGPANSNWNISGWSFFTNSAVHDGGGLYLTSLNSKISDCTFAGNSSGGNGGGFCPSASISFHIRNSTFSGNVAQGNGGGAYNAMLDNCFVMENHAANGGGVYGNMSNCVVNANVALNDGGGLFLYVSTAICANSQFTNNAAMNGGAAYGGIFSNCVFSGNVAATNGGAVYLAALSHCLIVSNQAAFGAGAFADGSSEQLYFGTSYNYLNCEFIGNSAAADGGGSYASSPIRGTNCSFRGNAASNFGGGAYGGTFSGTGTNFNNSALNGGGFYNVVVSNCEVISNSATGNGGGIYNGSLSYCIVSNNMAGTNGGGSYNAGLINCLESANSAAFGGGAYLGSLNNSTIAGNHAAVAGGGAYFTGSGTVVSCIIYDNTAPTSPNISGFASYSFCCITPCPRRAIQILPMTRCL